MWRGTIRRCSGSTNQALSPFAPRISVGARGRAPDSISRSTRVTASGRSPGCLRLAAISSWPPHAIGRTTRAPSGSTARASSSRAGRSCAVKASNSSRACPPQHWPSDGPRAKSRTSRCQGAIGVPASRRSRPRAWAIASSSSAPPPIVSTMWPAPTSMAAPVSRGVEPSARITVARTTASCWASSRTILPIQVTGAALMPPARRLGA